MLEVRDVHKTFGSLEVLKGVGLRVSQGDVVAILGPSGSGKTTLLRCINFLETAGSGTMIFDGETFQMERMSRRDVARLRKKTAFVFQNYNLFRNKTALQNVTEGLITARKMPKDQAEDAAMKALRKVGMADRASHYPRQLSGGQQQRVAIARALATDPKVLLCDEATSALDPSTTQSILELLKELNQKLGVTMVVITHQMNVIEAICHRVAILDGGVVAEEGDVTEIFANPRSAIGRQFVYPDGVQIPKLTSSKVVRVVFNGGSSYEPLIASLAIDCGVKVNILGADTRNIDGKAFGSMLLGLPKDLGEANKALRYLRGQADITVEEVPADA